MKGMSGHDELMYTKMPNILEFTCLCHTPLKELSRDIKKKINMWVFMLFPFQIVRTNTARCRFNHFKLHSRRLIIMI